MGKLRHREAKGLYHGHMVVLNPGQLVLGAPFPLVHAVNDLDNKDTMSSKDSGLSARCHHDYSYFSPDCFLKEMRNCWDSTKVRQKLQLTAGTYESPARLCRNCS